MTREEARIILSQGIETDESVLRQANITYYGESNVSGGMPIGANNVNGDGGPANFSALYRPVLDAAFSGARDGRVLEGDLQGWIRSQYPDIAAEFIASDLYSRIVVDAERELAARSSGARGAGSAFPPAPAPAPGFPPAPAPGAPAGGSKDHAVILNPAPGSKIMAGEVLFSWAPTADEYHLEIPAGVSYPGNVGAALSASVNVQGAGPLLVRLWSRVGSIWDNRDFQYEVYRTLGPDPVDGRGPVEVRTGPLTVIDGTDTGWIVGSGAAVPGDSIPTWAMVLIGALALWGLSKL